MALVGQDELKIKQPANRGQFIKIRPLCSIQRLSPFVENIEIFVVGVNAAVIAPGGFGFGQVFHRRISHHKFCYPIHYPIEAVIT